VADAVAGEETASFAHTVLVDFRARLRRSADPDRIFRVTCALARQLGLVGVKRVLDSAPLEDAVTTQDTVTMLRGAIRGLLRACPPALEAKVRAGLQREDDYAAPGKPTWWLAGSPGSGGAGGRPGPGCLPGPLRPSGRAAGPTNR